ncbi:MAG TPA: MASE4 domain-containing protein [Bryobacteraceae bacterium]|nr:MASE4 domain-containing protein [Bryobacteraceae bacterium]
MGVLFGLFCAAAPFATKRLPESDGFIPAVQAIIFVTDLTTAVLLFNQVWVSRSRAFLVLASAYLFTALIVVVHTLTFPRAFAEQGIVGAGLQTTGWLHIIWHFSFPAAVIVYVLLQDRSGANDRIRAPIPSVVCWSIIGMIALVCGILWFLTAADRLLPPLFLDRLTFSPLVFHTGAFDTLVCGVALVLLLVRGGSVLDQWLTISVAATTAEMAMVTFFSGGRFDLGWYSVRIFGVVSSTAVLLALITEITRLHATLSVAVRSLERERDNKLMNVRAITASIAHEIRQPLTAIALNAEAALKYLGKTPPSYEYAREALGEIRNATHHTGEVLDGLRTLFAKADQERQPVDVNDVIRRVLQSMQTELKEHRVDTRYEPAAELPLVAASRGQLQEVIFNLVNNAIEAMAPTHDRNRMLGVRTELRRDRAIAVSVQDTGSGIHAKQIESIFDPFVTTKAKGTGLGLAICRMIVEQHGGQLSATSDGVSGALFQFVLPIGQFESGDGAAEERRGTPKDLVFR